MKRFKVTNEMYKNGNVVEASRDNYAGDYVTAESEAEAIELYKDFLIEQIRNNNLNAEIVGKYVPFSRFSKKKQPDPIP